jgi:hypothetical protein
VGRTLSAGIPVEIKGVQAGPLGQRPAVGDVGDAYYATDTRQLFFGTGTGWEEPLLSADKEYLMWAGM